MRTCHIAAAALVTLLNFGSLQMAVRTPSFARWIFPFCSLSLSSTLSFSRLVFISHFSWLFFFKGNAWPSLLYCAVKCSSAWVLPLCRFLVVLLYFSLFSSFFFVLQGYQRSINGPLTYFNDFLYFFYIFFI